MCQFGPDDGGEIGERKEEGNNSLARGREKTVVRRRPTLKLHFCALVELRKFGPHVIQDLKSSLPRCLEFYVARHAVPKLRNMV